jgi:8-oxo-dGTP diphosphatase
MVDPKSFTDEVQLASGGILTRQAPEGIKIAVIHRPRYNDWCLPKGKVDQQETLREAALREIREETACEALITGFAGTSSYTRDDLPKVVYFWNMTPSREYEFKPSAEVDQLLWLTPRKALTRLSHREERDLIARAFRVKISRAGFFRALTAFIGAGDLRGKRLEGSIATFQIELMRKIEKLGDSSEADKIKCLESAQQLLDAADTSLKNGDVDNGWRCFHAALRMEVQSMKPGELRNQATMLMREAVKIRPRRWSKFWPIRPTTRTNPTRSRYSGPCCWCTSTTTILTIK